MGNYMIFKVGDKVELRPLSDLEPIFIEAKSDQYARDMVKGLLGTPLTIDGSRWFANIEMIDFTAGGDPIGYCIAEKFAVKAFKPWIECITLKLHDGDGL